MGHSVLGDYFALLVNCSLRLNIERREQDSRNVLDFVEWKRESKSSRDVIVDQFSEQFWLLICTLVVSKSEGVIDVQKLVVFVNG